MPPIAYTLRDDYAGDVNIAPEGEPANLVPRFAGGVINAGTRSIDLRAELDSEPAAGYIVVADSDGEAIVALDAVIALKRVRLPDGAQAAEAGVYDHLNHTELVDEARRRGLDVPGNASNVALREALLADDHNDETPEA